MKHYLSILLILLSTFGGFSQSKKEFDDFLTRKKNDMALYKQNNQKEFNDFCDKYRKELELFKKNQIALLKAEREFTELVTSDDQIKISSKQVAPAPVNAELGKTASEELNEIDSEIRRITEMKASDAIISSKKGQDSIAAIKKSYEAVKKINDSFSNNYVETPKLAETPKYTEPPKPKKLAETPKTVVTAEPQTMEPSGKPTEYKRISSSFGFRIHPVSGERKMHNGLDLAAPQMTPIYATASGTVTYSGVNKGYGNFIKINHLNGYKTAYAHMHEIVAQKGQNVKKGDLIGYVGTTGISTGNHLHYEIVYNDRRIDPQPSLLGK